MIKPSYCNFIFLFLSLNLVAQHVNPNFNHTRDNLRRAQLLGHVDLSISFNQWSIDLKDLVDEDIYDPISFFQTNDRLIKKSLAITFSPIFLKNVSSPRYPVYENDGNMAAQAGLQTLVGLGIAASGQWYEIQLAPELYIGNIKRFSPIPQEEHLAYWERLYSAGDWNRTDAFPSGFDKNIQELLPGQSFFFLKLKQLSAGLSSANLMWGMSQYHSLILSNHAGGFPHLTLHSNQPILIPHVGNIEFQIIGGLLQNSTFSPPYPFDQFESNPYLIQKHESKRYLNALNLSFSPIFIKGLHIGLSRSLQQYWDIAKENKDYLPVMDLFFRSKDNGRDDEAIKDQVLSLQTRWILSSSKLELYYVYGRNDASWNIRDLIMSPHHSMSHIYGLNKLIEINNDRYLQVRIESVQMAQSKNKVVRNAGSWYWHYQLRQGLTHRGDVLGASLPIGSNQQIIDLSSFNSSLKTLGGIKFSRTLVGHDFYTSSFSLTGTQRQWTQYSMQFYGSRPYKSFHFSGKVDFSRHVNFQYQENQNRSLVWTEILATWFPGR
jgi:hypothetical protein